MSIVKTRKKNELTQVDIGIAIGILTTHRVCDASKENIDCIESDCATYVNEHKSPGGLFGLFELFGGF